MTYQAGSSGKRINGISKEKTQQNLLIKVPQKKKLNRYTDLFRNFAGNKIIPVRL
jgi:hypothetical protein